VKDFILILVIFNIGTDLSIMSALSAKTAAVKMLPAYIRAISVGSERGEFLALDLGGTNFRVLLITLEGEAKTSMKSKIYRVPDNIQKGTGTAVSFSLTI
jgi:hexokinase